MRLPAIIRRRITEIAEREAATAVAGAPSSSGGNAFGIVAVSGQSNVVADGSNDTLTLVAGSNVTLTTNAGADSVTVAVSIADDSLGTAKLGGDITTAGKALLDDADAAAQRTTLALGSLATVTPTGTPDGTKYLRDDNSWQAVSGGSGLTHPQVMTRALFAGAF